MTRVFVDTNVFCYAYDHRDLAKRAQAEAVLQTLLQPQYKPVLSTQVLQEFYNTLIQKLRMTPAAAKYELCELAKVEIVQVTPTLIYQAADLHASATLSFWDALVVVAAISADCDELWSEDLQRGRSFGKLRIVNPL